LTCDGSPAHGWGDNWQEDRVEFCANTTIPQSVDTPEPIRLKFRDISDRAKCTHSAGPLAAAGAAAGSVATLVRKSALANFCAITNYDQFFGPNYFSDIFNSFTDTFVLGSIAASHVKKEIP